MSCFLSTATTLFMGLNACVNDERVQGVDYRVTPLTPFAPPGQEFDVLWPRSSMQIDDGGANIARIWDNMPGMWELSLPATGTRVRKKVRGVTRDSAGNPVGNVTVRLFNQATGVLVDTVVSDAQGNYELSDPNNVACFVVGYLAGAPDKAGTTKNNLTGV